MTRDTMNAALTNPGGLTVGCAVYVPDGIAFAVVPLDQASDPLFPAETAAMVNAVARRVREFRAGRMAARLAMARIGIAPIAIPSGPDRAPQWPSSIIGSISHCDDAAIAIVARKNLDYSSLGVDLEADTPLDDDLIDAICTPEERASRFIAADPARAAKCVFSIKEAAFKAQYPLTGQLLDFQQVNLDIQPTGRFTAHIRDCAEPVIKGIFAHVEGYILAIGNLPAR